VSAGEREIWTKAKEFIIIFEKASDKDKLSQVRVTPFRLQ
jgi:hypothetical protein